MLDVELQALGLTVVVAMDKRAARSHSLAQVVGIRACEALVFSKRRWTLWV